jgi:hypothetical protein
MIERTAASDRGLISSSTRRTISMSAFIANPFDKLLTKYEETLELAFCNTFSLFILEAIN